MKFAICALLLLICMVKLNQGSKDYNRQHYRHGHRHGLRGPQKRISAVSADTCSANGHKQACCDGTLGCFVQAFGSNCSKNLQSFSFHSKKHKIAA